MKTCRAKFVIAVFLTLTLLCGYSSLEKKVFDGADLFSDAEEQELQEEIVRLAAKLSLDIAIVTVDDAEGKSAESYVDDYYDELALGYEQAHGTGILFLIDMDNRIFDISTGGEAQVMYTDWEIDRMLDEIGYDMADGEYFDACETFLEVVKEYGTNSEVAENGYWDPSTDRFVEYTPEELAANRRAADRKKVFSPKYIFVCLLMGTAVGGIAVGIMAIRTRNQKAPGGHIYMKPGSEHILDRQDFKVNTTVTTRHIERSNGSRSGGGGGGGGHSHSSSHTSSGGHSHGGGGRRF